MLRTVLVGLAGIAIVLVASRMGSSETDRGAYALIAFSAGLGALGYPALLRRRNKPVSKRSVFLGSWVTSILLPLLITSVDGSSAGFIGFVVGGAVVMGAILAFVFASLYSAAYERIRNCPRCDGLVSAKATICKHCKSDIISPEAPALHQPVA